MRLRACAATAASVVRDSKRRRRPFRPIFQSLPAGSLIGIGLALWAAPARAIDQWTIAEVYSNANGSIQFIELYTDASNQNLLNTADVRLEAFWGPETRTFLFPHDLATPATADRAVLIGSAGYSALSVPPVEDFGPLDAGGMFFDPTATPVTIRLLVGVNTVIDSVTFDAGVLTQACSDSLNFPGGSLAANSPENFTGDSTFPLSCCSADADCPSDGIACTIAVCNVTARTCSYNPFDAVCDDGLFCNGSETCDPVLDCQPGSDPCLVPPELACDEILDACGQPAPIVVNSTGDRCDGPSCDDTDCTPTDCTLREAIHRANFDPDLTTIAFDLPGPGPHVIRLDQGEGAMEVFIYPVIVDGRTEPDYPSSTQTDGFPTPAIVLDGAWTDPGGTPLPWGLHFARGAAGSELYAIAVVDVSGNGVEIDRADGSVMRGCMVGQLPDGTAEANGMNGVRGVGLDDLQLGGPAVVDRNIIGPNGGHGLLIQGHNAGTNLVEGNLFGTNSTGTAVVDGIGEPTGNDIGAAPYGDNNIVRGNVFAGNVTGLQLNGDGNEIYGNLIGTDTTGTVDLGNAILGIEVVEGLANVIGGSNPSQRNIVSGNGSDPCLVPASTCGGILIRGTNSDNVVENNYIGVDASGASALPNEGVGLHVEGGSGNAILYNVISGNTGHGLYLDSGASSSDVEGNRIGTDATGEGVLANSGDGVFLGPNADANEIGQAGMAPNIVSGNDGYGVRIQAADMNTVSNNIIGLDVNGAAALPNGLDGVYLEGSSSSTLIGGSGAGNVISGNVGSGIVLDDGSEETMVIGNLIGTQADGATPAGNGGHGIAILDGVRSTLVTEGVIAHNTLDGVAMIDTGSRPLFNEVTDLVIRANGGLGIDLGDDGVTPNDVGGIVDSDLGPNDLQNFPVTTIAFSDGLSTTVEGALETQPGIYRLDFYSNLAADPSGFGEGETFLGSGTIDTSTGSSFSTALPVGIVVDAYITVTAFRPGTGTSEFSNAIEVLVPRPVGEVTDMDPAANQVFEGAAATTPVGITAFAEDPDIADSVSYSLDDDAGGRFAVGESSGVVTVANGALLVYETAPSHDIDIRADSTDGSFSNLIVAIDVLDGSALIFSDGFESGDMTGWSGALP